MRRGEGVWQNSTRLAMIVIVMVLNTDDAVADQDDKKGNLLSLLPKVSSAGEG